MNWSDKPIHDVRFEPARRFADTRGWLAELFRDDELPADELPAMGYVSVTLPGVTRGPHEHIAQTDRFGFFGPGDFLVRVWDARPDSPTRGHRMSVVCGAGNPMLVVVPPGVVHGYRNVSAGDGWVLNFPNRLYGGRGRAEAVDEIRHEEKAETLYRMDD